MKKAFKFILVFAAVYLAVVAMSLMFTPVERLFFKNHVQSGFTALRIPDFLKWSETNTDKPKLLVLGSSTAYRGIDPKAFTSKYNAFNLSSSSQTIYHSRKLLELAIAQNDSIHTILVDIFPENWDFSTDESTLDHVVNNPNVDDVVFRQMAFHNINIQTSYLWFYGWIKSTLKPGSWKINASNEFETYHHNGYVESSADLKPVTLKERKRPVLLNKYAQDLVQISRLCNLNNIKLYFVIPPQQKPTPFLFNVVKPKPYYINGNNAELKRSHFIDNHHLNGNGALEYSKWLFNQLPLEQ